MTGCHDPSAEDSGSRFECGVDTAVRRMRIQVSAIPTTGEAEIVEHALGFLAEMSASMRGEADRRWAALENMLGAAGAHVDLKSKEGEHVRRHIEADMLLAEHMRREADVLSRFNEIIRERLPRHS